MNHYMFDRLPKRLTISFPLWLIYGTKGEYSPYYNIDKVMREHAERGFNCIRIDSGAGLIHDIHGNPRKSFDIGDMFGEYEKIPRQEHIIGDGGPCDLLARLIETFRCAKKYGIYVILSQWYYLHTYWYHKEGDPVVDELFSIPPEERFEAFGKFWHYILLELEKRNLDSQIAFVEIFNEVNEHPYFCGDRRLVCGEGVSYIASKNILWEEKSERYWNLVKYGLQKFKEAGVWGTVIRTCCGPEDPCWDLCADKLLQLNRFFFEKSNTINTD